MPPPPQALPTKIFALARAPSSFPPAGTSISFSPLTVIFTGPLATSLDFANKIMATKARMITVNIETPKTISFIIIP